VIPSGKSDEDNGRRSSYLERVERLFLRALVALVIVYGIAVGVMALRETSLVYPGNGRTFRMLPGRDANYPWDTVRVTAPDSVPVLLMMTRVDTASSRPWVLYFHGNLGNLGGRGNTARYQLLRDAGFNILAVEYRGFGAMGGVAKPTERGLYADAAAAWSHLTGALGVHPDRVVLYGLSLGAGPATQLASIHEVGAIVTEGGATSLPDVGAERYPWVPVKLVMRNKFRNLSRAPLIAEHWVIFHGTRDVHVPFHHGERLAAANRNARLVPLSADHDGGVIEDRRTSLPVLRDLARRFHPVADSP
jgi:fermentation-respiration switch protein FrsA (DUF1100 family)